MGRAKEVNCWVIDDVLMCERSVNRKDPSILLGLEHSNDRCGRARALSDSCI